ncbi:hypothetical protein [Streptomyces violaceusniger]|uniref:hypothetical protein n=1 Tax=Streptomyces violaceusniger TaxID=68280 RepID=UPI0002DC13F8|nr:hypothetical protein [Streptomyces violaceusniger]
MNEESINSLQGQEYRDQIQRIEKALTDAADGDLALKELSEWAVGHRDWNVRRLAVETLAARFVDAPEARAAIGDRYAHVYGQNVVPTLYAGPTGLEGEMTYNRAAFTPSGAQRYVDRHCRNLEHMLKDPRTRIGEVWHDSGR